MPLQLLILPLPPLLQVPVMTYEERTIEVQVPRVVTETHTRTVQVPRSGPIPLNVFLPFVSSLLYDFS